VPVAEHLATRYAAGVSIVAFDIQAPVVVRNSADLRCAAREISDSAARDPAKMRIPCRPPTGTSGIDQQRECRGGARVRRRSLGRASTRHSVHGEGNRRVGDEVTRATTLIALGARLFGRGTDETMSAASTMRRKRASPTKSVTRRIAGLPAEICLAAAERIGTPIEIGRNRRAALIQWPLISMRTRGVRAICGGVAPRLLAGRGVERCV